MSDPFLESLAAPEPERGPFRTSEPTSDKRLSRAREESFDRVAQKTAVAIRSERTRERWVHRVLVALLGTSCVALGAVVVLGALGESTWLAWLCPALAAVISFAIATWKNRALSEAWKRN